jgi:hypothetical protein
MTRGRGCCSVGCDSLEVVIGGAVLVAMQVSLLRDVPRIALADDHWFRMATFSERV